MLGGSLGALAINQQLPEALSLLPDNLLLDVRHQCGKAHVAMTEAAYQKAGVTARIEPFIANMAEAYGWADLVVCRAGALTVSELAAAGVGSILIPYPYAIDDHQTMNGGWLAGQGAAKLIQQADLTPEKLVSLLQSLLGDGEKLRDMAVSARSLAKPNVAEMVADICMEVCREQ